MLTKNLLLKKLEDLKIEYKDFQHEPLLTVEQALAVASHIPGAQCKNLFLKDSKNNLFLIVAVHDTKIMLKSLSKYLKAPELRFADPNLLMEYLGVLPGSVTPFGLVNDNNHKIKVILDSRIFDYKQAGFHPLENTSTTLISTEDLKKFVSSCLNEYQIIDFLGIL